MVIASTANADTVYLSDDFESYGTGFTDIGDSGKWVLDVTSGTAGVVDSMSYGGDKSYSIGSRDGGSTTGKITTNADLSDLGGETVVVLNGKYYLGEAGSGDSFSNFLYGVNSNMKVVGSIQLSNSH